MALIKLLCYKNCLWWVSHWIWFRSGVSFIKRKKKWIVELNIWKYNNLISRNNIYKASFHYISIIRLNDSLFFLLLMNFLSAKIEIPWIICISLYRLNSHFQNVVAWIICFIAFRLCPKDFIYSIWNGHRSWDLHFCERYLRRYCFISAFITLSCSLSLPVSLSVREVGINQMKCQAEGAHSPTRSRPRGQLPMSYMHA